MTDRGSVPSAEPYSPQRRTALVLTGTGTAGAYHAGVLRALHEAGVKVDIVAGRGIGAVGALFMAIDGGQRLWDEKGFWRTASARLLYPWRRAVRLTGWALALSLAIVAVPIAAVAAGLVVFPIDFVLKMLGATGGGWTQAYMLFAERAFAPEALPTWLPRLVLLVLGATAALLMAAAYFHWRERRPRGPFWWRLVPEPLSSRAAIDHTWSVLWDLMRGAAQLKEPSHAEMARRYTEMLVENLGQPGFRELLLVVHDVDAGRDLVFALVGESRRRGLMRRTLGETSDARRAEVLDLSGVARHALADGVAAALTVPLASEFHHIRFAPDSYWRGEQHRLSDRPGCLDRVIEELVALEVEQMVLVTAAPESTGPHTLAPPRVEGRGRVGEFLQSSEAAVVRDTLARARTRGPQIFTVRPDHNPIGPFDFSGGFDDRSVRRQDLSELMTRGYEDAYLQFIEPVLGASGERVGRLG